MQKTNNKSMSLQNDKLKIKVNSNESPYLSADLQQKLLQPRRLNTYFIVLIESGSITYNLDSQEITLTDGELLFGMTNQFFIPPPKTDNLKYFKVLFYENTLALLPQQFLFFVNPLNSQKIVLNDIYKAESKKSF